jgi:hypothetical protein
MYSQTLMKITAVVCALIMLCLLYGPLAEPVYGQGGEPARVTLQLWDKPVLDVYRETLAQTGDPLRALAAALAQFERIRRAQASLIMRLTDPAVNAIIVRVDYLTRNEISLRVDSTRVEIIRAFPEVQLLTVLELTEYQATMGELASQDSTPIAEPIEFPAPGQPPGRP